MTGMDTAVRRFLRGSRDPSVADAALRALWPLAQKAARGRYELAARVRIDAGEACAAIALATGLAVDRIVIESCPDHGAFLRPPYGGRVDFGRTLGGSLLDKRWPSLRSGLEARYGPEWPAAKDEAWRCLRADIAEPLRLPFWDDPSEGPRCGAGESVMTALFYMIGFAAAGDASRFASIAPLVRLLPKIVPVCEDPTQANAWIAYLPPIAR
jgi:hypothetical protein